jgi:hypothetical protein
MEQMSHLSTLQAIKKQVRVKEEAQLLPQAKEILLRTRDK